MTQPAKAAQKEDGKKVKRPSAKKRQIQSEKHRLDNKACRSEARTAVKKFRESPSQIQFNDVSSLVDKAVNKGVYKKNKASRIKSRLFKKLRSAQKMA